MVGSVSKRVNLQALHSVLWYLVKKPVNNETAFDSTLAMENEYYFLVILVEKGILN
jgi:hypothetical protein